MGKKLDIAPQVITSGAITNLLNGAFASLSGPVGFTPTQPRIHVKSVTAVSLSSPAAFVLYKGASGDATPGTEVVAGVVGEYAGVPPSATYALDTVLEASDFLTGTLPGSGSVTISISAEIEY